MRLAIHTWLLRLDWRFGYVRGLRWLRHAVDWSCPSKRGERCPLWPDGSV